MTSVIPSKSGGLRSDGQVLLDVARCRHGELTFEAREYIARVGRYAGGTAVRLDAPRASQEIMLCLSLLDQTIFGVSREQALSRLTEELERSRATKPEILRAIDLILSMFLLGQIELSPARLEQWSGRLVELDPENATLAWTRAAVLLHLGRLAESSALFVKFPENDETPEFDRLLLRIFTARLAHLKGERENASRLIAEARSLMTSSADSATAADLLKLVESELAHPSFLSKKE